MLAAATKDLIEIMARRPLFNSRERFTFIVSSSRNHHRNIIHHQTCRGHTQRRENTREQTLKYQNFPESRIHKSLGLVQCSVLSCFFRSRKRRFFATIYLPILDMRRRRITINAPSIRSILVRQWDLTRLWWPPFRRTSFCRMKKMWSWWCQECSHHDHHLARTFKRALALRFHS